MLVEQKNETDQGRQNSRKMRHQLSLFDFLQLAHTYLADISSARDSVGRALTFFDESIEIRADQCNHAISLVREMDIPVQNFSQLLDQKARLPLVILPLRYLPATELACMKDELWKAKALIGMFRATCRNGTRENAIQRYEILCVLETLLRSSEDISQVAQIMFDRTRFQVGH